MAPLPTSAGVQAYVLCIVTLYAKFFVTARLQGVATYAAGARPPEDAFLGPLLGRARRRQHYGVETDPKDERVLKARAREQRWDRIIMNDLENVPFALFVYGAALLLECDETRLVASMGVFTAARFVFTYCYAKALQPHRTLVYIVGAGAVGCTITEMLWTIASHRMQV